METKASLTICATTGAVLTETVEGVTMPADYTFAAVNDFVHGTEVIFEELQWLCLGMATEIEKLRADAERYRWLRDQPAYPVPASVGAVERRAKGRAGSFIAGTSRLSAGLCLKHTTTEK